MLDNHTYTTADNYSLTITVTNKGGSTTTINSSISVVVPTATSITATEGNSFSGTVATFNGNVANVTGVTITWGDGTQSSGTWSGNTSSFTVSGLHTYAEEGVYNLSVTVQMSAGGPLTAAGPATVNDAALTATPVTLNVNAGQAVGNPENPVVLANFTDANPNASFSGADGRYAPYADEPAVREALPASAALAARLPFPHPSPGEQAIPPPLGLSLAVSDDISSQARHFAFKGRAEASETEKCGTRKRSPFRPRVRKRTCCHHTL